MNELVELTRALRGILPNGGVDGAREWRLGAAARRGG